MLTLRVTHRSAPGDVPAPRLSERIIGPRTAWPVLLVLSVFLLAACAGGIAAVSRATDAAPDFEITLLENENHAKGELLRLSDLVGSPVVLNFWFPSCPPCRAEMPDFEKSFQAYKDDGVQFVGVQQLGLDSVSDGQAFIDEFGITYAIGADQDGIIVDYKVLGFPSTVFLDKEHRIVRSWTGALNAEKLEEFIQELLQ